MTVQSEFNGKQCFLALHNNRQQTALIQPARRQAAQQLRSTLFRAYRIGELAVFYGDPNLINTRFSKIQNVGKNDIQRVAKTYLTEENRTVITTLPKPKTEAPAKAAN